VQLHWHCPFDDEQIMGQELEGLRRTLLSSFPGLQEAFVLEGALPRQGKSVLSHNMVLVLILSKHDVQTTK